LEAFHSLLVKTSILESKSEKDEDEVNEKEKDGEDKGGLILESFHFGSVLQKICQNTILNLKL
jgi:hypothetical protein